MATNFLSGYVAQVSISGTHYAFDKFDISEDNNLADVTTFVAAGAQQVIPGTYKAVIKASGPLDQGNESVFAPGAGLTVVLLFTGGVTLSVPVFVKNATMTADVKDAQRVSVELWSTGAFTLGPP